MIVTHKSAVIFSVIITAFLFGCTSTPEEPTPVTPVETQSEISKNFDAEFTLKTIAQNGKMLYIGVGGDIDGIINPDLVVEPEATVHITLIDGDGMTHDLFLPDFDVETDYVRKIGDQAEIIFKIGDMQPGSYVYYCTLPGHRKAGQEGKLIVKNLGL